MSEQAIKQRGPLGQIMWALYNDPKQRALWDFLDDYSLFSQLSRQVGERAVDQYCGGAGWPDPDAEVTVRVEQMPDWDWWEPRHDQPWRRQDARLHRGLDV